MDDFNPVHCDPRVTFKNAIDVGTFSTTIGRANYAGDFMYMYSALHSDGAHVDSFKNINSRRYITVTRNAA